MASSIAGKTSTPFCRSVTRLPPRMAGPSITLISRVNCGSATAKRCSTWRSSRFSGTAKFITSTNATAVATTPRTTIVPVRNRFRPEERGRAMSSINATLGPTRGEGPAISSRS